MKDIKLYFKSKEFIVSTFIIMVFLGINIYFYFKETYMGNGIFIEGVNRFSFWNYVMHYNFGSFVMFLSPIIISVLSLSSFYYKMSNSFMMGQLLRKEYKKIIIKEIILSYLKSIFPFIIASILIFILGSCLFTSENINLMYYDSRTSFHFIGKYNPYTFIIMYNLLLISYIVMIVNFGLIVLRITKRLNISIIVTFICTNALNFLVGNIAMFIGDVFSSKVISSYVANINIYESYTIQSTIFRAFIHTAIYIFISLLVIHIKYRSKEKMVNDFD